MTVGITLNNGLEGIAITDSRVSIGAGRQSDSVDKMGAFSHKNYSGAVYGTGAGEYIKGVTNKLDKIQGDNLDEFVKNLFKDYEKNVDYKDSRYINAYKKNILKKAELIDDLKKRQKFIDNEIAKSFQNYDQVKQHQETLFILVAYDKKNKGIRSFCINAAMFDEIYSDHTEIGIGSDGANLYLNTKLQGIELKNLDQPDLAFLAANAYGISTVNQGVGGTPKLARISKSGVDVLDLEKTKTLVNVSGAYLAEINSGVLTKEKARDYFHNVFSRKNPKYTTIARDLGLNKATLMNTYIPYSSWQETANKKSFNGNK